MAEASKIEWTDSTFNPWIGCTKIAPACDNCYAADMSKRYGWAEWGNFPRKRTSASLWAGPLKWQKQASAFFAEHGRRRRVFCASLADVFDNQVPGEWRADLWKLIFATPDLDWLLLTKRPQNIAEMLPPTAFWNEIKWHVWLGTTVEDQKHADQNIPHLLQHDSAVRFISAEPLLGPIDLTGLATGKWAGLIGSETMSAFRPNKDHKDLFDGSLNWVIAGGESGPHARPGSIQWYRSLRDQCAAAGVHFLFKQWGEWKPAGARRAEEPGRFAFGDYEHDPSRMIEVDRYPMQLTMFGARSVMERVGKMAAGRHLDGALHDGFPA